MLKKILLGVLCAFVILTVVAGVYVVKAYNNKNLNVLIYGIDGRETEESERSDAIILVNYKFDEKKLTVTSIPRDSYVKITCKDNMYDKINHAYAYGKGKCLNETVEQLFEIKDVKNITISFKDVIEIVDFFGLIEITPKYTFCQSDESLSKKYCFEKDKTILIDGKQALAYMRNRKSLSNGDIDRTSNQRQIFRIIMNYFLKLSLIEKVNFYNYFKNKVNSDIKISDLNLKSLISVNKITFDEYILRGEDYINKYYYYKLDQEYLEKIKKYYN